VRCEQFLRRVRQGDSVPTHRDGYRTVFQVDRDRVIHSHAFRRLQAKTQVFRPGEYDFYRTRLTHTIEVAQIGRSICTVLLIKGHVLKDDFHIDQDLVEAVCLAHDIGHPPFGHAGERALNALMSDFGGFEANAQTVRLLTETIWRSEDQSKRQGLNPSRSLLDGVLKYKQLRSTATSKNQFLYKEQQKYLEFAHPRYEVGDQPPRSIECQIMDWADDVAFSVGDLVDGVRARFITQEKLRKWSSARRDEDLVQETLKALESGKLSHFAANKIGEFVEACSLDKAEDHPLVLGTSNRYLYNLKIPPLVRKQEDCLKAISVELVFQSASIQQLEYKAQRMLTDLFEILRVNYVDSGCRKQHLLGTEIEEVFERVDDMKERARLLCDLLAGMSDDYAVRTYRRLADPEFGSIVDLV
jgi:dGTPase